MATEDEQPVAPKPVQGICRKCQKEHELCPKCGGPVYSGYGLAGGGIGAYWSCDECDYFYKEQDPACQTSSSSSSASE